MRKAAKKIIVLFLCFLLSIIIFKYFTFDRSAIINTEGGFIWHNIQYIPITIKTDSVGGCIAKTTDGHKINKINHDPSNTFLELRSFLDNNFVVREDYVIPTEGQISCVYINDFKEDNNLDFINILPDLISIEYSEKFYIQTDNLGYYLSDIYIGYEDCPVGTQYSGWIGRLNSKYVYVEPVEWIIFENGYRKNIIFECNIIPDKYYDILYNCTFLKNSKIKEINYTEYVQENTMQAITTEPVISNKFFEFNN